MLLKTAHKIALARVASSVILKTRSWLGLGERLIVTRQGIRWNVDPREGFDLSIYLLGSVEPPVIRAYPRLIRKGDVILDVGANIGGHTLHFARLCGPEGLVIAVEPSDWAMAKLQANLDLNPELRGIVRARQFFLGAPGGENSPESKQEVYASWPLDHSDGLHEKHLGKKTPVTQATVGTIDSLVQAEKLSRVDAIKIDVDGDEWKILKGSAQTLEKHRPVVIMELAPYLFSPEEFNQMISFLEKSRYAFFDATNGRPYPTDPDLIRKLIPEGATGNVILRPSEKVAESALRSPR